MKEKWKCSICGENSTGFGHNPEPIKKYEERCCDQCNWDIVVPVRIFGLQSPIAMKALSKHGFMVKKERR